VQQFPTCKYVKQKTIASSAECSEGEIVERRSKKARRSSAAIVIPIATFVAWGKPIPEKCPECGGSYLIEKFLKAGAFAQCPNAECKYKSR